MKSPCDIPVVLGLASALFAAQICAQRLSGLEAYEQLLSAERSRRADRALDFVGDFTDGERRELESYFDDEDGSLELFDGDTLVKSDLHGDGIPDYVADAHVQMPREGFFGDFIVVMRKSRSGFETRVVDGPRLAHFATDRRLAVIDLDADETPEIIAQRGSRFDSEAHSAAYSASIYGPAPGGFWKTAEIEGFSWLSWRDLDSDGTIEILQTTVTPGGSSRRVDTIDDDRIRWTNIYNLCGRELALSNSSYREFFAAKRKEYEDLIGKLLGFAQANWSSGIKSYFEIQAIAALTEYVRQIDRAAKKPRVAPCRGAGR